MYKLQDTTGQACWLGRDSQGKGAAGAISAAGCRPITPHTALHKNIRFVQLFEINTDSKKPVIDPTNLTQ